MEMMVNGGEVCAVGLMVLGVSSMLIMFLY